MIIIWLKPREHYEYGGFLIALQCFQNAFAICYTWNKRCKNHSLNIWFGFKYLRTLNLHCNHQINELPETHLVICEWPAYQCRGISTKQSLLKFYHWHPEEGWVWECANEHDIVFHELDELEQKKNRLMPGHNSFQLIFVRC